MEKKIKTATANNNQHKGLTQERKIMKDKYSAYLNARIKMYKEFEKNKNGTCFNELQIKQFSLIRSELEILLNIYNNNNTVNNYSTLTEILSDLNMFLSLNFDLDEGSEIERFNDALIDMLRSIKK